MTPEPVCGNLLLWISVIVSAPACQQVLRQTGTSKEDLVSRGFSHATGCVNAVIPIGHPFERSEIQQVVIARPDGDYVATGTLFARGGVREELRNA